MTAQRHQQGSTGPQAVAQPGMHAASGFLRLFSDVVAFLTRANARARKLDRQRQAAIELTLMSDHALRDIGLHRSEILSVTHNADRFERYERRRHARI